MLNNSIKKRAQVGETMTWMVATIIIILVLIISISISNFSFGKNRDIKIEQNSDILASKSMLSYLLTAESEGKTVYLQIKDEGNLNSFNGNLGISVFSSFNDDYPGLWLGVADKRDFFPPIGNDYFLTKRGIGEIPYRHDDPGIILEEIKLDENLAVALVLPEKRK